jgi:hypothetical protein
LPQSRQVSPGAAPRRHAVRGHRSPQILVRPAPAARCNPRLVAGAWHARAGKRPRQETSHERTPRASPITLTTSDYNNLLFTAVLARRLGDLNAEFLISELTRASVCDPDDLPEDVVSTNCRVIYRIFGEPRTHAHLLVHPKDLLFPDAELSVITPLGAALLGTITPSASRLAASSPDRAP